MKTSTSKKFTSLKELGKFFNAEKTAPEKWQSFLTEKGHTQETFNYRPETLKNDLKFSFARKTTLQ